MQEFVSFYFMAGVYIAVAVFVISAIVAVIEKVFGLNQTPRPHQILQATRTTPH